MAALKCQHCGYTRSLADQHIGKEGKCPQCGNTAKIYDTALLLTLYSKKVLEIQSELKEVKQVMAEHQSYIAQPVPQQPANDEHSLNKLFRENRIAMTEFNDATKLRNTMMLRMGESSTYLLRFSVVGFLVILVLLSFFMIQVSNKTDHLSGQLASIGGGIQASTQELHNIQNVISSKEIEQPDDSQVKDSIHSVKTEVDELTQEIASLNKRLKKLSDKYNSLYYPYR
ncbi:hypothetical protein [Candidatus Albibeggiatoa sp. nov. NOAA]|uniref:hypothetical protein n=1 Tax=Candidatus Albibeggiatoa sp. nov. NOAA TaxID=3162724 RepID=UPI0032FFDF85|nr:hypothetical protein [Thiotrichaceae bacterium]